MTIRIKSLLSSGPLWVPLTSGTELRLAPGQVSQEMPGTEVQENQAVDSLVGRGMIEILSGPEAGGGRAKRAETAPKTTGPAKPAEAGSNPEES
jgi:hypothetical protein